MEKTREDKIAKLQEMEDTKNKLLEEENRLAQELISVAEKDNEIQV